MISNSNDVYSDEYQSKDENVELVRQLDDNDKFKTDNINNLEELLKKSRRLNNSITTRLIDEKLENLSNQKIQSIENLILSCNQIRISNQFNWTHLPKKLRSLDLSGNFLSSINEIEKENNQLESLALSFNEINQISDVFSIEKWSNLCLLDISYNMLRNLKETIESLKHLSKLRILYLHGNPLSLLVDYRIYVVNSLEKLIILDDIRITAEERFRSRTYSIIDRKDKDYALFQITFSSIENVPTPPINQNEWPLQIHRYKMRLDWFEEEEDIKEIDIPFDKMSNFKRFKKSQFESSSAEHKPNIDLSPNTFNLTINNVIPFRDFLFHGSLKTVENLSCPCQNNGECTKISSQPCTCPNGFTGRFCENLLSSNSCRQVQCLNHGTCYENLPGLSVSPYCLCKSGYTGKYCEIGNFQTASPVANNNR
ncbi:unnamed protein product [Rotaria sordida]|uniref:EGF-like domain-containing protein n=1 Tax=Rotaria sordida TaxID=392033 RepID=A0A814BFL4_9BILA|nr:unnamed protein product [Rotaria sordida]